MERNVVVYSEVDNSGERKLQARKDHTCESCGWTDENVSVIHNIL